MTGGEKIKEVRLSFLNRHISDAVQRRFALEPAEIVMLNPNTGTLPIFRTRRDADITLACYRRHPILIRDGDVEGNSWGLRFSQGLFNMASDSGSSARIRPRGRRRQIRWMDMESGRSTVAAALRS